MSITIDKPVRDLVVALNLLPNVTTHASCGGHADNAGRRYPALPGTFYVNYSVPKRDPAGQQSLALIDDVVSTIQTDITNGIYPDDIDPANLHYSITGAHNNGDVPKAIAETIRARLRERS